MRTAKLSGLVNHFGRDAPDTAACADGELLARFVASRDEPAFAELVRRHGPLVFAVCRRVTGSHHLAEDAFQAVFVVLATKAASVRPASALPGFLHAVACRTALRARTMNDRRRRREAVVERLPEPADSPPEPADDLAAILDEEIARLPDALRTAVVLCELEGCPRKVAAERLGVPEGTVSSRLAAARKALGARLRARGLAFSAAALSATLTRQASAGVPTGLAARAVSAATSPALAPAAVAALSHGVLRLMLAQKLKVALPLVAVAIGALAFVAFAGGPPPAPPVVPPVKPVPVAFAPAPVPAKVDPKPLPKGPNKLLFYRDGHIVTTDPDGTNQKRLIDTAKVKFHPAGVSFSPDGTRACLAGTHSSPEGDKSTILVVRLDGKDAGTDHATDSSTVWVCWSADGTKLLASEVAGDAKKARKFDVVHNAIDLATGKRTKIDLPSDLLITDWARDGRFLGTQVAKAVPDKDEPAFRLWIVDGDGKPKTEIKAPEKNTSVFGGQFSPSGKQVLIGFAGQEVRTRWAGSLAVYDIATDKLVPVADVPLNAEIQGYCWSPDGKRIAYSWHLMYDRTKENAEEQEIEWHVTVCDPDGKNPKTVASEKGRAREYKIGRVDWR